MMPSSTPMTSEIEDEYRTLRVADGGAEMPKPLLGSGGDDAAISVSVQDLSKKTLLLFPMFTQPAKRDDFLQLMDGTHVCLEHVSWVWSGHHTARFEGAVIVNNLEFEKRVAVKYTTDGWKTQSCCVAAFSGRVDQSGLRQLLSDGNIERDWDRFHFCFDVSDVGESTKVAFYVEYATNSHGQKWDNNGGRDYGFVVQEVELLSALTCIASGVAQTQGCSACIAADVCGRCDGGLDCRSKVNEDDEYYYGEHDKEISYADVCGQCECDGGLDCRCEVNEDDEYYYYYDEDDKEISSYAEVCGRCEGGLDCRCEDDEDHEHYYDEDEKDISSYTSSSSSTEISSTAATDSDSDSESEPRIVEFEHENSLSAISESASSHSNCEDSDCSICDSTYTTTYSDSTTSTTATTSGTESYHSGSEDEEEKSIEYFGQDEIEASLDAMLDEVSKKLEDAKISDEAGGGAAKSPVDVKHVEITYNCGDLPAAKVRPGPGPAPLLIDLTVSDDEDHEDGRS